MRERGLLSCSKRKRRVVGRLSLAKVGFNSSRRRLAHLEADEAADRDLVAELFRNGPYGVFAGNLGILFDKALIDEAIGLVEFLQHALDNFLGRLRRGVLSAGRMGANSSRVC